MEGDLYRIGTPYDDTGYYGMMYVSKDKKKAVLFTYCIRYQSRTLIPKFRLHGLDAKTRYTVREQNTDKKGSGSTAAPSRVSTSPMRASIPI